MTPIHGSNFRISDSRIPDFLHSLKRILIAPPPFGLRGSFDFEKKFKDSDNTEFFYFKYALILYILKEERVNADLQKGFKHSADLLLEKLSHSDNTYSKINNQNRLGYYSDKFPRIFGKGRFVESSVMEDELYRFVFQKIFANKYTGRSESDWQHWFSTHTNETEIIPQFIIWYHETILTVLTLFDESLWPEHI